ncbi:MAG TPA: protein translocase subunit SecD [Candidatus Saccharimonadales bacterium]|nr:protein translocase subunit SecD [Candidatus Saccharimonadales bacterium]
MSLRVKFWLILLLAVVTAALAYPREDQILKSVGIKNTKLSVKQGLDLQGGAHLVFQANAAELKKLSASDRNQAMTSLIAVIQKRANPTGTSEIAVQREGSDRVIVELPGVKDINDAIDRIGKTANLAFLEIPSSDPSAQIQDTGLSGKDVERADVDFDTQRNQPIVTLTMKGDAVGKFGDLTTRINKEGGRLVTLLDQAIIFGPATVSTPITDGHAQLQGNFKTVAEARKVADQINAGALPIPVQLVEERSVGATLGQESIARSVVAGVIGLLIVALFMVAYYRLAGLIAVLALIIYALLTLTLYKLSALTPSTIVLTLAGTAGFILSIGMAVDANILIFERLKEELRAGKSFMTAMETAFDRAWTSIRDSNVSTLITCIILYIFGAPIVKGFAVTLGLGVLVSLFTAVVISRTFLRMVIRRGWGRKPGWYGLPKGLEN